MFIDYYEVLEIKQNATLEEIKIAFKKQALKWHPDKNLGIDTTEFMKEINEAYLILKDAEARERYDKEYIIFNLFKKNLKEESNKEKSEKKYTYSEYYSSDDTLNNWMKNAKQQAEDLANQTIEDFKGMVSVGLKEATKSAGNQFVYQIFVSILLVIIFTLSKSCSK